MSVACAILAARLLDKALAEPDGKAAQMARRAAVGFVLVCLMAMAAVVFLASHTQLLARPLGISVAEATQFNAHAPAAEIMLLAFALFAMAAVFLRNAKICFVCFMLFPLLLVNVNYGMLKVVFDAKSARTLAREISPLPPQTELACLECFPSGLTFYLGRTATLITKDGGELTSNYILFSLKSGAAWPSNLVAVSNFDHWLATRKHPVYLVVREQDRARLEAIAAGRGAAFRQLTPQYVGALLPPS